MRRTLFVSMFVIALAAGAAAAAQEHADHRKHTAAAVHDGRQWVNFPPEMRAHTLANMRDHLLALSEILSAMAEARYGSAARTAATRLGIDSPSAEGCKAEGAADAAQASTPGSMDLRMAQFMPEGMRRMGLDMHRSATAFAAAATAAETTGNPTPALAALSRVTQQCAGCHAAYRVQ